MSPVSAASYLVQGGSIASSSGAVYAAPCRWRSARGMMAETDDDDDDDYDCAHRSDETGS
ncbi:hypothetical protein SETIT_5G244000v2 [Setaria italica]|uniref:Uncharacterized protein n=1 Tax=Setaria italica TaxID=4555 RepID=A0A368R8G3_SETIT|nr:hypothetical protein SETIT_5G244000v2 [Setaria italica]